MKLHYIVLLTTIIATAAVAEDPRGRLPDGRAFRTDLHGNQVVDYIAELEVAVDNLTRQVQGLEYESQQKQVTIDSLRKHAPELKEKNLVAQKEFYEKKPIEKIECTCPEKQCPKAESVEDNLSAANNDELEKIRSELSACQGTIHRKEKELAELQNNLESVSQELGTSESTFSALTAELTKKQEEIEAIRDQIENVQKESETLQRELQEASTEKDVLSAKRTTELKELETAQADLTKIKEERKILEEKQGEPEAGLEPLRQVAVKSETKASLSPLRLAAMSTIRDELKNSISDIKKKVVLRDSLYTEYVKSPHVVAFKPTKAISSQGKDIAQMEQQIEGAGTARELSLLAKDIELIRSRIHSDITLMQRMSKLVEKQ